MGAPPPVGSEGCSMRLAETVKMFTVASESPKGFEQLAILTLCASLESGRAFFRPLASPVPDLAKSPNFCAIA
jgi:hypothetical protein